MVNKMKSTDQIQKNCTCYKCGADCFAVTWLVQEEPKGRVEVMWKCSQCGRQFITNESVDAILPAATEVPESSDLIDEILE